MADSCTRACCSWEAATASNRSSVTIGNSCACSGSHTSLLLLLLLLVMRLHRHACAVLHWRSVLLRLLPTAVPR
jgi:hypothetical protein